MNKVYLKKDIVRSISKKSGYSQRVCEDIFDAYHDLLVEVVENADRIQDFGYIDLSVKYVAPHTYGNPQDNSIKVEVGEKYKIKTKIGKTLKDATKNIKN